MEASDESRRGDTRTPKRTETAQDRRRFLSTVVGTSAAGLAGCALLETNSESKEILEIVVGSKNYTEQVLLGLLGYVVLSENTDHIIVDSTGYGSNEDLWPAVESGEIDVYFEYMGSMWSVHPPQNEEPIADEQKQYERLKEQVEREHDLIILERTDWENTWVLFGTAEVIEQKGFETISDLATYVNNGNYDVTIILEQKFYDRPDGWPQLTEHYGFKQEALETWEQNGGVVLVDTGLTYSEVDAESGEIGLGYSTNAQMAKYETAILEDDKNFWPHYNVIPVVNEEVATQTVRTELSKVIDTLEDAETMQMLNARVDIDQEEPLTVARTFLRDRYVI